MQRSEQCRDVVMIMLLHRLFAKYPVCLCVVVFLFSLICVPRHGGGGGLSVSNERQSSHESAQQCQSRDSDAGSSVLEFALRRLGSSSGIRRGVDTDVRRFGDEDYVASGIGRGPGRHDLAGRGRDVPGGPRR